MSLNHLLEQLFAYIYFNYCIFSKDADHSNFRMILAIFILSQFSSCAKEMTKSSVGSDHRADPEVTVTASVAHV